MKINKLKIFLFLITGVLSAQVGIGNTSPKSTLDVTGQASTTTVADGIIAPRLTGDELAAKDAAYLTDQIGAQIYLTAPATTPAGKTINITSAGYYFFDGSVWQKVVDGTEASKWKTDTFLSPSGISRTETLLKPALNNNDTISYKHLDKIFRFKNNLDTRVLSITLDDTKNNILNAVAENKSTAGIFTGSYFHTFGTNPAGQSSSGFFSTDYTKNVSSNVPISALRLRPTFRFATGLVDTSVSNYGLNNTGFLLGGGTFNRYTSYHASNQINEGSTIVDYRNYNSEVTLATAGGLNSNVTNLYHYFANGASKCPACTITNQYGLYVANMNGATNNFAIYTNLGKVSFGGDLELRSITTGTAVNGLGVDATGKVIRTLVPAVNNLGSNNQTVPDATVREVILTNTADLNIDSNTLYVDGSANNVGIGTATPETKIDIVSSTARGGFKLQDGNQAAGKVLVSDATGKATWETNTGGQTSHYQNLTASTASLFTIPTSGFVSIPGINTYTAPSSGKYFLTLHTFFTNNTVNLTKSFYVEISLNGTPVKAEETYGYVPTGSYFNVHYPVVISANAGDVIAIKVSAASGGDLQIEPALAFRTNLDIIYLGL